MSRRPAIVVPLMLLGLTAAPRPAAAQSQPLFVSTPHNTLHYNHEKLAWSEKGGTACDTTNTASTPLIVPVLRVADGDPFVIEFCKTDPRVFRYTISAIQEKEGEASSTLETTAPIRTTQENLTSVRVVFRHNQVFRRYRVTAVAVAPSAMTESQARLSTQRSLKLRTREIVPDEPAKPAVVILYGVAFDVLVDTKPGWDLTVSGGVAFSNLTSQRFYLKNDTKGTTDANDDTTTVEEDTEGTDTFRPDIIALANIRPPTLNWTRDLGVAFGLGIGDNSDPRYFLGPSYTLGNNFIFTAGWTGGRVDTLPAGQRLGSAPINGDNTLGTLGKRFRHGFYVGVAFTFIDRTDAFTGAFESSSTVAPDTQKEGEEGGEGTGEKPREKPAEKPAEKPGEKPGEKKPGGAL